MVKTIDMQDMRYLNLFEQKTRVRTRFCFKYNENIIFCVPKPMMDRAIGPQGRNLREISRIIGKRVRVIPIPRGPGDAENFIKTIINPLTIRDFKTNNNEITISAGKNKAALIGRNKRRLLEMQKIINDFFGMDFRIA